MGRAGEADWDPLADEADRVATEESREEGYLSIRVLDETYALPVERVVEILRRTAPTRVPTMPAFVEGVVDLRGQVVPVLDLRVRFGSGLQGEASRPVVVVRIGERTLGLLVDGLAGLRKVAAGSVRPLPAGLAPAGRSFVTGVLPGEAGRFEVVLDPDRLLREDEELSLAKGAAQGRT